MAGIILAFTLLFSIILVIETNKMHQEQYDRTIFLSALQNGLVLNFDESFRKPTLKDYKVKINRNKLKKYK